MRDDLVKNLTIHYILIWKEKQLKKCTLKIQIQPEYALKILNIIISNIINNSMIKQ